MPLDMFTVFVFCKELNITTLLESGTARGYSIELLASVLVDFTIMDVFCISYVYMYFGKEFENGNISSWSKDTHLTIKKIIKKKNFIIIGSSMGAWIALNQFKKYNKQIEGFIGIGAAPEFLERLMWKKFNNKIKKELIKNKLCIIKRDNYEYPISLQLIKDGKKNSFFSKKSVTMIHGDRDEAVPINFSKKTLKIFINAKKKLRIIKKGDHSLSSKKNIKILLNELNLIIKCV